MENEALNFVGWLMDNYELSNDNSLWSYEGEDYTNEKLYNIFLKGANEDNSTLLTTEKLDILGFKNVGKCEFDLFENMSYWVKNGICLFYNTPVINDYQEAFYIGFAEMRQGKYIAVAFKWITTVEELTQIYESIQGGKIIKED